VGAPLRTQRSSIPTTADQCVAQVLDMRSLDDVHLGALRPVESLRLPWRTHGHRVPVPHGDGPPNLPLPPVREANRGGAAAAPGGRGRRRDLGAARRRRGRGAAQLPRRVPLLGHGEGERGVSAIHAVCFG
jgi:hypothetical protein